VGDSVTYIGSGLEPNRIVAVRFSSANGISSPVQEVHALGLGRDDELRRLGPRSPPPRAPAWFPPSRRTSLPRLTRRGGPTWSFSPCRRTVELLRPLHRRRELRHRQFCLPAQQVELINAVMELARREPLVKAMLTVISEAPLGHLASTSRWPLQGRLRRRSTARGQRRRIHTAVSIAVSFRAVRGVAVGIRPR
jgi:hypothetical protein